MNSFDLLEQIDVLAKLPKDFYTELESKKWLERKAALEIFLQILTDNSRLATNVSYHTIVSTLKIVYLINWFFKIIVYFFIIIR